MVHTTSELLNILNNLRDISDFCEKWPLIREAHEAGSCSASESEALMGWLVKLADLTCANGEDPVLAWAVNS